MSWEDQGRQEHGRFGNGTSGATAEAGARPTEEDVARQAVGVALTRLSRRVRAEFEEFAGQDGGKRVLWAMSIWADAASMDPAVFRRTVVGPVVSKPAADALQAMGRALAAAKDGDAAAGVGAHMADALSRLRPAEFRYDLASAQDQAIHAAVQGQVPDRPAPPTPPGSTAVPALPTIVVTPDGPGPAGGGPAGRRDVPTIAAALATMAVRLGPAAFAEAAAALLNPLSAAVLAALVLYLLTKGSAPPDQEGLVPPAVPPDQPGLVPPPAPAEKPGEGGFTVVPPPIEPGAGGTMPTPVPPHKEEGPTPAPAMPVVMPKITPEEKAKQEKKLTSLGLPTKGRFIFKPPKTWRTSQPLPRGPQKGYMDADGNEWVKPRGQKLGSDWHWDVQFPNGRHRNVTKHGQIDH